MKLAVGGPETPILSHQALVQVFPEFLDLLRGFAHGIDLHHCAPIDHGGGEVDSVVQNRGRDGAVLRERDCGFRGYARLGSRPVDDEDKRLAPAFSDIDGWADGDPCGSVSTSATGPAPCRPASTAICPERVVFPDPPFCEANTMTRIDANIRSSLRRAKSASPPARSIARHC